MGTRTFDFLADSFLLNEEDIADGYAAFSDAELEAELARYRNFATEVRDELVHEVIVSGPKFRVFPGIERSVDLYDLVRRTAFYVEQFVVDDPLFAAASKPTQQSEVMSLALGMSPHTIDRPAIANAAALMRSMRVAAATNVVKFIPFSGILEPEPQTPLLFSEDRFVSSVPPHILAFMRSQVQARSSRKIEDGYRTENGLYPSRSIHVGFNNASFRDSRAYHLFRQEVRDFDDATREVSFSLTLPETPPSREEFDAWVDQSINQTARSVFEHVQIEQLIAADLRANYLTTSTFIHDLLRVRKQAEASYEVDTANTLLNVDLPFLEGASLEDILAVRNSSGDAFAAFRELLESRFITLQNMEDEPARRHAAKELMRQLGEHEIPAIEKSIRSARRRLVVDVGIAIGGLVAAVPAGGVWAIASVAGAVAGGVSTAQTVRDRLLGARDHQAFFLWKLLKKRR